MSFWNLFRPAEGPSEKKSHLQTKVTELLPGEEESTLILVTCIAGLFSRVAYADMEIAPEEVAHMEKALLEWTELSKNQITAVVELTLKEVKDLAGIENHKYTDPLNEILSNDQRYKVLVGLFSLAASDGNAEQLESEEIRIICKGLLLEHKHFISARATVLEHLGALKN
ncbi:MAG: TerB family tellurite resistance protein [Bacteriovoracaceae bacterium]|nr:TerB family tellurite resistance protein [Bacteriovoracaceae bacterium]